MKYHIGVRLDKKLRNLKRKDKRLLLLVHKQLELFESNENHPSLRKHKLSGGMDGYWSISINMSMRMIYFIEKDEAYFINIGAHEEVYNVN